MKVHLTLWTENGIERMTLDSQERTVIGVTVEDGDSTLTYDGETGTVIATRGDSADIPFYALEKVAA